MSRVFNGIRPRWRIGATTAALMVAAAGLAAGVSVAPAQQDPAPRVTIEAFQFRPRDLEARSETRVTWTNDDDVTHTVTSGTPEGPTNLFNGVLSGKGTRFEFSFAKAGTYEYFCSRHPHMRGGVTIR